MAHDSEPLTDLIDNTYLTNLQDLLASLNKLHSLMHNEIESTQQNLIVSISEDQIDLHKELSHVVYSLIYMNSHIIKTTNMLIDQSSKMLNWTKGFSTLNCHLISSQLQTS